MLAKLYGNRAEPLIHIGEIEQARDTLAKAERAAESVGDRLALADVQRWRSRIAAMHGDLDTADRHIAQALELAADPSLERAAALRGLAQLRQAQGRPDETREAFRQAQALYAVLGAVAHAHKVAGELEALDRHSLPEPEARFGVP